MAILRKKIKNESSIPIGMIATFWLQPSQCPDGWVICDGRSYVDINGQTQTAPNLIGLYPLFSNTNIGEGVGAGLPNIKGTFGVRGNAWKNRSESGAASAAQNGSTSNQLMVWSATEPYVVVTIDASKSSSIYGNSSTVTPPSVRLLVCMKIR